MFSPPNAAELCPVASLVLMPDPMVIERFPLATVLLPIATAFVPVAFGAVENVPFSEYELV